MGTSTLALLFTNPLASGECEQNEQSEGVTAEVRLYLPIVCVWRSGGGDWPTPLIPPTQPPPPPTPLQVPLTMPISIHLSFSQEAAVRGLALDGGRKWTVTDSSRLERERETNELWGESWGFASEKIRMAFGSGTKMLGCIRHTVIATLALCFFPSLPTERPDCTRERRLMSLWFSSLTSTFT